MKTMFFCSVVSTALILTSCMVAVNGPDGHVSDPPNHPPHQVFTRATSACFPFQDNTNRWHYTEAGGNTTTIHPGF